MSRSPTFQSHPNDNALAGFATGRLPHDEVLQIEEHLRSGCLTCMFAVRDTLEEWSPDPRSAQRDFAIGSIEHHVARAERKALLVDVEGTIAADLIAELMLRSPSGRREVVRGSRRYKLLGLSEALREESRREARRDVARALELAELSAEVADCLGTKYYGPRIVADTRALAWAMVGNSHRVAGEFFAAERAFRTASDLLERGTGNPSEVAEVQVLLASLRIEQAQFNTAIRLLEEAAATYRQLGLSQQEARAIFKMGNAAILAGEPERSLELFDACLDLLDTEGNPKMVLLTHHNIATALNDSGASEEAYAYLESLSSQYDEYPEDRTIQIQRQWLEGLILARTGRTEESIEKLTRIRRLFLEEEQAYDTAQVTLDLSGILLEAGETQKVKRLVQEMYPVFRSQDVHRQAIAALVLFEQAVTQEAATVALARDVGRYLAQARNNPYLRFEPAGSPAD
jgi:tetratricopeptide (TPR) repeat protein